MEPSLTDAGAISREWLGRLSDSGYRVTAKNRAIVEIIAASERALDAVAIFDQGRAQYPGLGLVTVYRTIQKLEELGLVERLHREEGCNRVLRAAQGHEHFLVCNKCGKVVYFSGDDLRKLSEQIALQTGFVIQAHWLQLFGMCAECSA